MAEERNVKDIVRVIKFESMGSGPCAAMQSFLDNMGIKVEHMRIDSDKELSKKYNINVVPTLLILKDGIEEGKIVGFNSLKAATIKNTLIQLGYIK